MTRIHVVHIRLLNEPVKVWRPVMAAWQAQDIFRILEQDVPSHEIWEFVPGQTIFVETVKTESEDFLAAIRRSDEPITP